MARPRSFDAASVTDAAADCFTRLGYAATSVDDLVSATGLHRGSLYGAFGSKRGVFLAALTRSTGASQTAHLDLLLVAALELAPRDAGVREEVRAACARLGDDAAGALGARLLQRAGLTGRARTPEPTTPASTPTGTPSRRT